MSSHKASTVLDTRKNDSVPFLSFVVPCFNVEACVRKTLESFQAASSGFDVELILIDDGSSDQTLGAIQSSDWANEVLILTQENRGLSCVRNLGASFARGKWLAFLDSDDQITHEGFKAMWSLAASDQADVILGRSEIFGQPLSVHQPFYDAALWDLVLKGRTELQVPISEAPLLLALEPNMNYRWIRRSFYIDQGITFPEGLFFEDAPAHFQMLLGANRVALTSKVYYLYRVNRPGKITEQTGLRRFDVIPVIQIALKVLFRECPQPIVAAFGLRVLYRLSWGCGVMVPLSKRYAFFRKVVRSFEGLPEEWIRHYYGAKVLGPAHWFLGYLMSHQMALFLYLLSLGHTLRASLRRFAS